MSIDEFESAMYNLECCVSDIKLQYLCLGAAISNDDPFRAMAELAQLNKLVRDGMEHALLAQSHKIAKQVEDMQRFA